jgi:hypothetical protein
MGQDLSRYRKSEFALTVDILGIGERMASMGPEWLEATLDVLNLVTFTLWEVIQIAAPSATVPTFQYADTVTVAADDPDWLVRLGMRLLSRCTDQLTLVQAVVAGGGIYHITDPSGFGSRKPLPSSVVLQVLTGPAAARGQMVLKGAGAHGPRLLIDEETVSIPSSSVWQRYEGPARHQLRHPEMAFKTTEVVWWQSQTADLAHKGIAQTTSEIALLESGGVLEPPFQRILASLKARLKHLEGLVSLIEDDSV